MPVTCSRPPPQPCVLPSFLTHTLLRTALPPEGTRLGPRPLPLVCGSLSSGLESSPM